MGRYLQLENKDNISLHLYAFTFSGCNIKLRWWQWGEGLILLLSVLWYVTNVSRTNLHLSHNAIIILIHLQTHVWARAVNVPLAWHCTVWVVRNDPGVPGATLYPLLQENVTLLPTGVSALVMTLTGPPLVRVGRAEYAHTFAGESSRYPHFAILSMKVSTVHLCLKNASRVQVGPVVPIDHLPSAWQVVVSDCPVS